MTVRRNKWSFWIALAAAYLLAAQTVWGGAALASGAAKGVICTALTIKGRTGSGEPSNHQAPANCCLAGCAMCGPAAALPPPTVEFGSHQPIAMAAEKAPTDRFVAFERRLSHHPRDPPCTA